MPLAGKGMLLTSMDVDAADEAEFNRWYDREHLEERVAIDGFLEARRYVAHNARPKYLCLYSTATIEVLDSPAYRARLAKPTEWSKKTMARFKNMIRAVMRITISRGQGRGAALGIVRLRPSAGSENTLRAALREMRCGGSFLKAGGIYVGFQMELHHDGQSIVTTRVRSISRAPECSLPA